MHVGVLTTSFPRFPGDHAGSFVLASAQALARRGHRVDVLAPEPKEVRSLPRHAGVATHWVPYLRPRCVQHTFYGSGVVDNVRRNPLSWAGLATFGPCLAHAARDFPQWDAVLSHWFVPSGVAASRSCGRRPHVAVVHSADAWLMERAPRGFWHREVSATSAFWFVTKRARDAVGRHGPIPAQTLLAPMAVDAVEPSGPLQLKEESPMILLVLARMVPIKGIDNALRAVRSLKGVELWLAGDGPERKRLEAEARRSRAPVHFLGFQHGEQKEKLLRQCDALIIPSVTTRWGRSEGIPTVALEAARAGTPIIASDTGGLAECFPQDAIRFVREGDAPALEDAIRELRDHPARRACLATNAFAAVQSHGWDLRGAQLEALLQPRS